MAEAAGLERRVRRLERRVALLAELIVVLGDEIHGAAGAEDVKRRLRELTADFAELRSDSDFED